MIFGHFAELDRLFVNAAIDRWWNGLSILEFRCKDLFSNLVFLFSLSGVVLLAHDKKKLKIILITKSALKNSKYATLASKNLNSTLTIAIDY